MLKSRIVLLATVAVAVSVLTLGLSARTTPASGAPACDDPQAVAFEQLKIVAAAHGTSIPDGVSTYTHFGKTVLAHAPLTGIEKLTESDLAKGAPIMAIFVQDDGSRRIPNGVYIVRIQFQPGEDGGSASYLDAAGNEVVRVDAVMRDRDEINHLFPGAYDEPPPPSNIPVVTSTHVWWDGRWAVDCTGPGWDWRVVYY